MGNRVALIRLEKILSQYQMATAETFTVTHEDVNLYLLTEVSGPGT